MKTEQRTATIVVPDWHRMQLERLYALAAAAWGEDETSVMSAVNLAVVTAGIQRIREDLEAQR